MKNQTVDEFNRAKVRMTGDIRTVIADGEDLLKAAAEVSGEGFAAARKKFEDRLADARTRLGNASRAATGAADSYVHASPWTAIGIAAAAGMVIGILAARR